MLPFVVFIGAALIFYWWSTNNREGDLDPDSMTIHQHSERDFSDNGDSMQVTGYVNGEPRQMVVAPIGDGHYLRADAANDFRKMREACLAECGEDLPVSSAFRTMEQQETQYNTLGPTVAARPGFSLHQNGIALDLNGLNPVKANYRRVRDNWLSENCERFGWKRAGLNFRNVEPWHLEYTG